MVTGLTPSSRVRDGEDPVIVIQEIYAALKGSNDSMRGQVNRRGQAKGTVTLAGRDLHVPTEQSRLEIERIVAFVQNHRPNALKSVQDEIAKLGPLPSP